MIRALAARYRKGDFFAGRASLFGGRFGTLWPVGVQPVGQAVTLGMQGSGKSTGAAIPGVLLHDGPVIAFDPKGEIAERCYARRGVGGNGVRGLGNLTYVIDPTRLTKLPRARYNPLHEIERETDPDKALRLMFALADASIKNDSGGADSWVFTGARNAVYLFIAYVMTAYPHELRTLMTVRELAMEGDKEAFAEAQAAGRDDIKTPFDALLDRMIRAPESPYRHVIAAQAANLQKMGDRQRGAVLDAFNSAMIWLEMPQYRDAVSECDFYLSDFSTQQISLFICVPLPELQGIAAGLVRMFLVMFTTLMYNADAPPKKTVLCLVDEFPQFGHINGFSVIGPTMRHYGVKLWILLQDLGQLKATYPKDWESYFGCSAMTQYFSIQHGDTLNYMVASLGEGIVRQRDPDTGRMVKRPYPLLDRIQAALFLRISDGNCIAVRYSQRPFRLKAAPYFWYLPYWMYSPDPRFPEPSLRAWLRRRAVRKAEQQGTVGKKPGGAA